MAMFRSITVFLAVSVTCLFTAHGARAEKCKVALGAPAPALMGQALDGVQVDLGSMRGKWVYLDFWASWCKPCMRELPSVVDLHQQMATRNDFAVMSIALDDASTLAELRKVADKYQVNYPVVCDTTGWHSSHVQDWCVEAIPTTFLIDPNGRVVERDISPGQVENYIKRNVTKFQPAAGDRLPPAFPPVALSEVHAFNAKHRLLRDSPTSGKRGYRDFQLSLPSPATGGSRRYLIVLRVDEGGGNTARIRYDLEFSPNRSRQDFPFAVTIREATGERSIRLQTGEKSTSTGTAVDFLPGAQVAFDAKDQRLLFVLPLPPGLASAAYTTSLFNPGTQVFENTLAADVTFGA